MAFSVYGGRKIMQTDKLKNILKQFGQEFQNSAFFKKVLYSYLWVSCVIFIIFIAILFVSNNQDYREMLEDMQEQTISQSYNINQTTLKDIISFCYTTLENPSMNAILYGDNSSVALAMDASELIDSLRNASSLVSSVYFINFRSRTIIDQNGRSSFENHIDGEIFEILERMTPSTRPVFLLPRTIDYQSSSHVYEDVPVLTTIFYSSHSGALVVNLSQEAYSGMISLDGSDYIDVVMVGGEDTVITANDPALFGADYSDNELYRLVRQASGNSGSLIYKENGQQGSVRYIKNRGFDITYICTLKNRYFYSQNAFLGTLLQYTVIYLLTGIVFSFLLSWFIYNPLRELKTFIASRSQQDEQTEGGQKNDFSWLSSAYQQLLDMNENLKQISHAWHRERRRKLFRTLLYNGQDQSKQYSEEMEALNAELPSKNNRILLLGVDPASMRTAEGVSGVSETRLLNYILQNVTQELLSREMTVQHIDLSYDDVILLLNFDEWTPEAVIKSIREAQAFVETHYQITFSAGVGEMVEDPEDLSLSFVSAQEALAQRFITGSRSIHMGDELQLAPVPEQIYPYELADALIGAVKSLNPQAAESCTKEFFDTLKAYRMDQILSFILQLSSSLQRLEYGSYMEPSGGWDYRTLEKSTLADIREEMIRRCLADIEQLARIREASSGKKEQISRIIQLVEENIYNPNLSVVWLADNVHLSVNYLRNIFKEGTGTSLSVYITRQKLELICSLLVETGLSLNEISDRLGFSTKNYFFTFFKKHTGMTPGDYRRMKKKEAPGQDGGTDKEA